MPTERRHDSGAVGVGVGLETNSRQMTPKHHGRPAIIRDQRTRPVNKIDHFAKSANLHPRFKSGRRLHFPVNSMVCSCAAQTAARKTVSNGRQLTVPRRRKLQTRRELSSTTARGRGVESLRLGPRRPWMDAVTARSRSRTGRTGGPQYFACVRAQTPIRRRARRSVCRSADRRARPASRLG